MTAERRRYVSVAISLASLGVVLYSAVQVTGIDPWTWVTPGQDRAVFGTLGNSNTSAGFIGCAVALNLGLLRQSKSRLFQSALGSAAVLSCVAIGVLGAFQGVVAAVVGITFFLITQFQESRSIRSLIHETFIFVLCLLSLFVSAAGVDFVIFGSASILSSLSLLMPNETSSSYWAGLASTRPRRSIAFVAAAISAALLWLIGFDEVQRQVSDGFRERKFFFSAGWRMFLENPIWGKGVETYGMFFTQFRPEKHALLYETNRTSSAHNIFLGMLSNGGLVLGLAYLLFILSVGYLLLRNWRHFVTDPVGGSIGAAWIATQIQSVVSVEHVALFVQQFVLAGLVVACCATEAHPTRFARRKENAKRTAIFPLVGLVMALLCAFPLLRPIRADGYGLWSLRYGLVDRQEDSLKAAQKAHELAPWSGQQGVRLTQALYDSGSEEYVETALETVKRIDFTPPYSIEIAYGIGEAGLLEEALAIAETALEKDPFAKVLRDQVADLYIQIGAFESTNGKTGEAREHFLRAVDLKPSEYLQEKALEEIAALGE